MRNAMRVLTASGLMLAIAVMFGCGLDGTRARFLRVEGEYYILKKLSGTELRLHVDERTHKDELTPGDNVQAYYTNDGHAEFITKP